VQQDFGVAAQAVAERIVSYIAPGDWLRLSARHCNSMSDYERLAGAL
jgi:hypothetical protein